MLLYLKRMCNFEPEFYADKLVSIAARTAKNKAKMETNLICTPNDL